LEGAIRLAEILGALSLTTDLGAGVPFEKGLRTCLVASALAELLGMGLHERRDVYFAALLRSLGCTTHASLFAELFDDDVAIQRELKLFDLADPAELAAQTLRFAGWAGPERGQELADRFVSEVPAHGRELSHASCEVSAALGRRLGLPDGAIAALDEVYERFDGRGFPDGRAGDELTLAARIVHVAEQAALGHYDGGGSAARARVARRAGGQLDPEISATFLSSADDLLLLLDAGDPLTAVLDAEPPPRVRVPADQHEHVSTAFATFADLKGRFLLGHSGHVATLAGQAAALSGYGEHFCRTVRTSALFMDIGRVGVSSAIWDRPGPLGPVEWERVRLHSYWTERILRRCPALERLAPLAPAHHERLNGSGYHRAARGIELSAGERLLQASDVFAALTEPRPYREALTRLDAASTLQAEVSAGRLDAQAVGAVGEAAGLPHRRAGWPNELTDREVEVLRVLARGLTNREIADILIVSPRTVQHHLASVYDKLGVRSRAGAAVFAIEQGLVPAVSEK
jgi:HD-GYP domain-containing protein (c-di-GMP phosphodiesterase class II)/DNA-binding CsgD family transcriptional regulator